MGGLLGSLPLGTGLENCLPPSVAPFPTSLTQHSEQNGLYDGSWEKPSGWAPGELQDTQKLPVQEEHSYLWFATARPQQSSLQPASAASPAVLRLCGSSSGCPGHALG